MALSVASTSMRSAKEFLLPVTFSLSWYTTKSTANCLDTCEVSKGKILVNLIQDHQVTTASLMTYLLIFIKLRLCNMPI